MGWDGIWRSRLVSPRCESLEHLCLSAKRMRWLPAHGSTDCDYDPLPLGEHSRQEVARSAGVDPGYIGRLTELGILRPGPGGAFSHGDARRARWVHSLEEAGVPLDEMAAAVREGALSFSFLDAAAFDRFTEVSSTTFKELSARTGIPLDHLKVIREAVGFAEPRLEEADGLPDHLEKVQRDARPCAQFFEGRAADLREPIERGRIQEGEGKRSLSDGRGH